MGNAKVLKTKEQLVFYNRGHHLRVNVLQNTANYLRNIGERDLAGVVTFDANGAIKLAAIVVGDSTREACGECGLAGAGRSNDADEVTWLHVK